MPRLLVVDDEPDIRALYAAELEEEGYEVETAGDVAGAAKLLAGGGFDLVILDIRLGRESGLELLQKIVRERKELPVILSTAYSSYKDEFSSWLADAYVVKSSDLGPLKEEIRRQLKKAG